jgi:dTDP-4-amino-4,6-dideoxygalactose transaminase
VTRSTSASGRERDDRDPLHYPIPLHLEPVLESLGYARGESAVAEQRARTLLSLPMFPELGDDEVSRLAQAVRRWAASDPGV